MQTIYAQAIPDSLRLDNTTEAEFIAKVALADKQKRWLYLDRFPYLETPDIQLPRGVNIVSDGCGGFRGPGFISPTDSNTLAGLLYVDKPIGYRYNIKGGTVNLRTKDQKFIRCERGIMDSGTTTNVRHKNINSEGDYFEDCMYAMLPLNVEGANYDRGRIRYTKPENAKYGVECNGGSYMKFRDWDISYGRSGIIQIVRSITEAPHHNEIIGGTFANISEEFIGFDSRANEFAHTSLVDLFTLDGSESSGVVCDGKYLYVSWNTDTIADPTKAALPTLYANRDIRPVTGKNRNGIYRISGAPQWTRFGKCYRFAVSVPASEIAQFKHGDKIAVVQMPQFGRVEGVTINMGTPAPALNGAGAENQCAISFWGAGYGVELSNVEINGGTVPNREGLRLSHVSGVAPRSTALCKAGMRSQLAVSGVVVNNVVLNNADLVLTNHCYGPNIDIDSRDNSAVDYTNFLRNITFTGDGKLRRTNWRDRTNTEGATSSYGIESIAEVLTL